MMASAEPSNPIPTLPLQDVNSQKKMFWLPDNFHKKFFLIWNNLLSYFEAAKLWCITVVCD